MPVKIIKFQFEDLTLTEASKPHSIQSSLSNTEPAPTTDEEDKNTAGETPPQARCLCDTDNEESNRSGTGFQPVGSHRQDACATCNAVRNVIPARREVGQEQIEQGEASNPQPYSATPSLDEDKPAEEEKSDTDAGGDSQPLSSADIEQIQEESYRQGLRDGKKVCQDCEERMSSLYQTANTIAVKLEQEHKNLWSKHETEMVELALAIAKKIIVHELSIAPEVINSIVSEALQKVKDREIIAIRINPDDAERIDRNQLFSAESENDITPPKIIADPKISPGGCIVETNFGDIDGTFETRWQELEDSMLEKP